MHACAVGCIEKKPRTGTTGRESTCIERQQKTQILVLNPFQLLGFPSAVYSFFSLKLPLSVGRNCFHSDTKTLTSGRAFAAAECPIYAPFQANASPYRMHAVKYSPSPPLSFPDAKEFLNSFIPILFHFFPQSIQMFVEIKVCCPHNTSLLMLFPPSGALQRQKYFGK